MTYENYDSVIRTFLQTLDAQKSKPIYQLPVNEARQVLNDLQKNPEHIHVDIEDTDVNTPTGPVSLRIIRPEKNHKTLPAILYFHGGGWILGNRETHDRLIRELAVGCNAAVVFVNYTPSPEAPFPVALEQGYAALTFLAQHGSDLNIDGSKIVVAGDSAGGDIAAALCILNKQRKGAKIAYQVLCYPVTDANFNTESYKKYSDGPWLTKPSMEWFWNAYEPDYSNRKNPLVAPLNATIDQLKDLPPTLIITDENDVLRDEGEAYAKKLIEAGVQVTAVRYQNTIHDFLMLNALSNSPATRSAILLITTSINNVLHPHLIHA